MQKDKLQAYKDAMWAYLLEHSDREPSGALFVKFHTDSRKKFEGHVAARVGGYHRGDWKEKELVNQQKEFDQEREKWEARERYLLNRIKGKRKLFWMTLFNKIFP